MTDNKQPDNIDSAFSANDLPRRLDNLKWSAWHTKITILLGIGWAFDAFEVAIVGALLPRLKKYFQVNDEQATIITTVWLLGALVGALSFGYFGDRFGRKISFVVTICFYSVMTVITACSYHYPFFLVFRFLTAIGVGAEYTAVNASISEFIPSRHRGKVNSLVMGFWAVGALVANGVQVPLIKYLDGEDPSTFISWRIGFAIGGLASVFVLFARKSLPESPRWLLVQGRFQEADEVVNEIEVAAGQPNNRDLIPPLVHAKAYVSHVKMSYFQMVKELVVKYPFRLVFGCLLNGTQAFTDYGVSNLMSLKVLHDIGVSDADTPLFFLYGVICTVPGYLSAFFLIDRVGRKVLLPSLYIFIIIVVACFIPAYYADNKVAAITGVHCLYQFAYVNIMGSVYPSITEAFPTHLRATGIGFAVAFGRILAAVAPLILVAAYNSGGKNIAAAAGADIAFLGLGLLMALAWTVWGVEGKNRTLEDMNDDDNNLGKSKALADLELKTNP